jgi:hypothetical protein
VEVGAVDGEFGVLVVKLEGDVVVFDGVADVVGACVIGEAVLGVTVCRVVGHNVGIKVVGVSTVCVGYCAFVIVQMRV